MSLLIAHKKMAHLAKSQFQSNRVAGNKGAVLSSSPKIKVVFTGCTVD